MMVRMAFVLLAFLAFGSVCHGGDDRWLNFAEDSDLRYYLDQKSIHPLPDNVYLFWVKSEAKDKAYYKTEYNLGNLAYVFTNYELDCAISAYRIRSTVLFDKNKKELRKTVAGSAERVFEPIQPESVLELAQQEICGKSENTAKQEADDVLPSKSSEQKGYVPPSAATTAEPPSLASDQVGPEAVEAVEPANPFEPAMPPGPAVEQPPAPLEQAPLAQPAPLAEQAPEAEPALQAQQVPPAEQLPEAQPAPEAEQAPSEALVAPLQ